VYIEWNSFVITTQLHSTADLNGRIQNVQLPDYVVGRESDTIIPQRLQVLMQLPVHRTLWASATPTHPRQAQFTLNSSANQIVLR